MNSVLGGRISLVTGASRGIGAATAIKLAELGSDVVLNYRSKTARAEEVAAEIQALGRRAVAVQADLTDGADLERMMRSVQELFGRLDILILNASGGLEKGKDKDYAMALNRTAQLETAKFGAELMQAGGRIVFVTSHWAHFYPSKPVIPEYEVAAESKRAGEDALRELAGELHRRGVSLVVVSGDAVEGTITLRLLERRSRGAITDAGRNRGGLPTVDEFACAIVQAAADRELPSGHTIFVGSTEW